jgi:hypothetical protein
MLISRSRDARVSRKASPRLWSPPRNVEEGMPQVSGDIGTNFSPIWASGLTMMIDFIANAAGKTPTREEFEGLTWSIYQFGKTITAAQYQLLLGKFAAPLTPNRGMAAALRRLAPQR